MNNIHQRAIFKLFSISFLIWLLTCILYLHYFDRYETSSDDVECHSMLKGDPLKYWISASNLIHQIRVGVSPLIAGGEHRQTFLYPRLLAAYGLIGRVEFFNKDGRVVSGGKFGFLLVQTLIYYASLFFFYHRISQVVPSRIAILSTAFLGFEPTILQFHTTFLTESLYLSFELLVAALFIRSSGRAIPDYIIIGILLGLMFLQRSIAVLYVVVLLVLLIIRFRKSSILPGFALVSVYLSILFLLGLHNYYRAGFFYVTPTQGIDGPLNYLANYVIADVERCSPKQAKDTLISRAKATAYEKGILIDDDQVSERDKYKWYLIQRDVALDIFKTYPFITLRRVSFHMLKSLILDPVTIYMFTSFEYKPKNESVLALQIYRDRHLFKPVRWSYAVVVHGIVALGLVLSWKRLNTWINLFFILSILYLWMLGGWLGNNRYMLPALVFYSIYIALALDWLLERTRSSGANIARSLNGLTVLSKA